MLIGVDEIGDNWVLRDKRVLDLNVISVPLLLSNAYFVDL